jgi:uncharacterized membrane protein YgcG
LEICLQKLENGAEVESVLASYPHLASELRPILMASIMARSAVVPEPSPEAIRRGRAKVLQHAAQLRETKAKVAPRSKRMIPIFQRLAISFTLTALFLSSGTGLVSASSSALPGENLYPVKLTWENVRLLFTFDEEYRETLANTFENERLQEVNELLVEGRDETIQFAGVYMEANGITYVSGIHVVVLNTSRLPTEPLLSGAAVTVTGHTNAEGFVDVESIELLPSGTVVPTGEPPENETGNDSNGTKVENNDNGVKDDTHTSDQSDAASDDKINGGDNASNDNNANDNTKNNNNSNGGGDNSGSGGGSGDNSGSGSGGGDNSGSGGGGGDNSGGGSDD